MFSKEGKKYGLRKVQGKAKVVFQINMIFLTPRSRSKPVALKSRQFFRSGLHFVMRRNVTMPSSKASLLDFLSMAIIRNRLELLVEQVLYKIKHLNGVLCMRK